MNHFFEFHEENSMAEINVTPLVDVMLVLLITFMITMPVLTHSIALQLPRSQIPPEVQPPVKPLRLAINHEGYFIDEERFTFERLQQRLRLAKHDNPDVVLAIAADQNLPYLRISDALNLAQQAGIHKIALINESQAPQP